MRKDFEHTTQNGNLIRMSLYGADRFSEQPCIVYLHGFKGFKDWGFVPYAGEYFAKAGFSFLCFNFSHNGIGDDPMEFTEFGQFEQNTFTLEVSEAKEVIHLLSHTDFFGAYHLKPTGLIGHSRGGGIALLAALENDNIKAVSTWASVCTFDRWDKKTRQAWRKQTYAEVVNQRTGQVFRLGIQILDDIEKNTKTKLNIQQAVSKLNQPLLFLHGAKDESVPYFEAETLTIFADPASSEMKLIPDAGHTFETKHPFEGSNPQFDQVLDYTRAFFDSHLKT